MACVTDKTQGSPHNTAMQITCPHCQASYELETDISETALLCQRCGHEFAKQTAAEQVSCAPAFPERPHSHILPWLMIILTILAATGFGLQYDAWMDKRWLRSSIINLGIPLPLRDKDWMIVSDSIQPTWITRPDGNTLFMIKGQVKNLLSSSILPPHIEIVFFDKTNPDQRIASQLLDFTKPPPEQAMQQAGDLTPEIDNKTIAGLATRQFTLLITSLPPHSGDFSLTARNR